MWYSTYTLFYFISKLILPYWKTLYKNKCRKQKKVYHSILYEVHESTEDAVLGGVPQGCVFEPLPFLIPCINYITNIDKSGMLSLFYGDALLLYSGFFEDNFRNLDKLYLKIKKSFHFQREKLSYLYVLLC